MGRCDDQNIPDSRQHQGAEGVINHWFVVDGQELFAHCLGDGMEARAAATGQDDSLAFRCRSHPVVASPSLGSLQHERSFDPLKRVLEAAVASYLFQVLGF